MINNDLTSLDKIYVYFILLLNVLFNFIIIIFFNHLSFVLFFQTGLQGATWCPRAPLLANPVLIKCASLRSNLSGCSLSGLHRSLHVAAPFRCRLRACKVQPAHRLPQHPGNEGGGKNREWDATPTDKSLVRLTDAASDWLRSPRQPVSVTSLNAHVNATLD